MPLGMGASGSGDAWCMTAASCYMTTTNRSRDYRPECRDLVRMLRHAGWIPVMADDGEEKIRPTPQKVLTDDDIIEHLCGVDEATLWVQHDQLKNTKGEPRKAWLFLVLGNDPGELVCDHVDIPELCSVTSAHSDRWDGTPQRYEDDAIDLLTQVAAGAYQMTGLSCCHVSGELLAKIQKLLSEGPIK